jgi:hypothetical protein
VSLQGLIAQFRFRPRSDSPCFLVSKKEAKTDQALKPLDSSADKKTFASGTRPRTEGLKHPSACLRPKGLSTTVFFTASDRVVLEPGNGCRLHLLLKTFGCYNTLALNGEWPSGKAPHSGCGDRRFDPFLPSQEKSPDLRSRLFSFSNM